VSDTSTDKSTPLTVSPQTAAVDFAHASERVAAQILDFYRIRWEYEPTTFPIEWDRHGKRHRLVLAGLYLPDLDLYIELTTMNPERWSLRRTARSGRLKELYPDVNIKILYQKDFRKLLFKFGILTEEQPYEAGGGYIASTDEQTRGDGQ